MTPSRFKTHYAALGIELRDVASTWFWRFVEPALSSTWHGPYESDFEAHPAANASRLAPCSGHGQPLYVFTTERYLDDYRA